MRNLLKIATAVAAVSTAAALLAAPATAASTAQKPGPAVFVQTDGTSANHVVAYRQNANGTLTLEATYATGGKGGVLANSVIDHTASQGGVTYDRADQLLFVVNAGSNTISSFAVNGFRLTLRQVVSSYGSFPVSIAQSRQFVYALNAHGTGSVQGYLIFDRYLLPVTSWHRSLGLDPTLINFTQTPGQVSFTPSGAQLLVTTKANTFDIDVFHIDNHGALSGTPTVNHEPGAVPFAIAYDRSGNVAVANAGTASVTTYRLSGSGRLTQLANLATGQKGTCWVVARGNQLYTTNPGSASVTLLTSHANGHLTLGASATTDAGTVDPAVSANGQFIYVETGAAGIVDEFRIAAGGALTRIGSVTVAHAAGAEGIATA